MLVEFWPSNNLYCLYLFSLMLQMCPTFLARQKRSGLTTQHLANFEHLPTPAVEYY